MGVDGGKRRADNKKKINFEVKKSGYKIQKMPRGRQADTVTDRPGRITRNGSDEAQIQKPPRTKRVADENAGNEAKSRKRAAFGDLTNATNEKSSFSKQVKKGLSNIVNLSRGASTANKSSEINAKKFKLAAATAVTSTTAKSRRECSKRKSDEADSLPSSQETKIKIDVKEDDESEYESAEENVNDDTVVFGPKTRHRYEPPSRLVPPPGVEDYDLENWDDPNVCSEYAMDIFSYYKAREAQFRLPDYISIQPEISKMMRAILVDWLVEVQESFELNHETLYTAVKILDSFMSKKVVQKEDLQLVGATACLIACKIDERIPPMVDDFLYVCDDAYSRDQLMKMERKMLSVVGFDLGYSLSYRFVRRYGRVCRVNMPVLTLARYILETALLEYKFNVEISESKLAASALVLAMTMKGIEDNWVNTLAFYSGYTPKDLEKMVKDLFEMLKQYPKENLKTVRQKYSHRVFHEVATIPLPKTIDLQDLVCDLEVKKEEDFEVQTE